MKQQVLYLDQPGGLDCPANVVPDKRVILKKLWFKDHIIMKTLKDYLEGEVVK